LYRAIDVRCQPRPVWFSGEAPPSSHCLEYLVKDKSGPPLVVQVLRQDSREYSTKVNWDLNDESLAPTAARNGKLVSASQFDVEKFRDHCSDVDEEGYPGVPSIDEDGLRRWFAFADVHIQRYLSKEQKVLPAAPGQRVCFADHYLNVVDVAVVGHSYKRGGDDHQDMGATVEYMATDDCPF
jgi:hypothetical protein